MWQLCFHLLVKPGSSSTMQLVRETPCCHQGCTPVDMLQLIVQYLIHIFS